MTRLDGIQAAGRNLGSVPNKMNSIDEQIEVLNSSIPEQTSKSGEKETAIRIKQQIIVLMQEKLKEANRNNNAGLASSIQTQIKVVEQEIDTIKSELLAMTNIFDSNESDDAVAAKSSDFRNSVFG